MIKALWKNSWAVFLQRKSFYALAKLCFSHSTPGYVYKKKESVCPYQDLIIEILFVISNNENSANVNHPVNGFSLNHVIVYLQNKITSNKTNWITDILNNADGLWWVKKLKQNNIYFSKWFCEYWVILKLHIEAQDPDQLMQHWRRRAEWETWHCQTSRLTVKLRHQNSTALVKE